MLHYISMFIWRHCDMQSHTVQKNVFITSAWHWCWLAIKNDSRMNHVFFKCCLALRYGIAARPCSLLYYCVSFRLHSDFSQELFTLHAHILVGGVVNNSNDDLFSLCLLVCKSSLTHFALENGPDSYNNNYFHNDNSDIFSLRIMCIIHIKNEVKSAKWIKKH